MNWMQLIKLWQYCSNTPPGWGMCWICSVHKCFYFQAGKLGSLNRLGRGCPVSNWPHPQCSPAVQSVFSGTWCEFQAQHVVIEGERSMNLSFNMVSQMPMWYCSLAPPTWQWLHQSQLQLLLLYTLDCHLIPIWHQDMPTWAQENTAVLAGREVRG